MARDYKIRNVVESVLGDAWAILPEKLDAICSFLEARVAGQLPTEEQIQAALASRSSRDEDEDGPKIIDGVQVIDVVGTLAPRMNLMSRLSGGTSTMQLAKDIREAQANEKVRSILLYVDSPGGAASYTQEVADLIRSSDKRIVASATNLMASGAYWIGVAAHEVYASPSTEVGSIGVYSILSNSAEYYAKQGIKFTVLRAGNLKAAGNPYEELTQDRKVALEDRVNAVYAAFVSSVASYRRVSIGQVEKSFGQGTVFLADQAASRGMIDGVMTFEEVLSREQRRVVSDYQTVASKPIRIEERVTMDPKLKAALFARGLVASMDASDDVFEAAASAYCLASGIDREHLLKEFTTTVLKTAGAINATVTQDAGPVTTQPVVFENNTFDSRPAVAAERVRVLELQARGELLGISAEDIQAAIEDGTSLATALDKWTKNLAKDNRPITPVSGEGESEKVVAGAAAVLMQRCGLNDEETAQAARQYGSSFAHSRTTDILRVYMRSAGHDRIPADPRQLAQMYLEGAMFTSDGGSINSRGAHPDLLSSLTRKALTMGATIAPVAYPRWCTRIEDLPDFKPRSFIDVGIFNRLDAVQEKEEIKEQGLASDLSHWIAADSYANKVGLSVDQVVDDDLGGFARQLQSLGTASRMTINAAVIELLVINPVMPDGISFFHSSHANIVTGGDAGAPSTTTMNKHRYVHRMAKSFGAEYPMSAPIDKILAPSNLEESVMQTVAPFSVVGETKVPITDATLNMYRGKVEPVIDAFLDDHSTSTWYTLIPMALGQPMVYAFQSGFGEEGRRDEWYEPSRRTRWVSVETRFGVAMANWRAMVRNA